MKKVLLFCSILFALIAYAATDTDSDGVADEADICPRVYARSPTGCPTLAPAPGIIALNSCLTAQKNSGKIIANITPICDATTKVCPKISNIFGAQSCDPLFPVIFDAKGAILVRGAIYILDYTK